MSSEYNENCIEWLKDSDQCTLTLTQRRFINRIEQLSKSYPEECQITARNKDGSICAHVPTNWIKIIPPRNLSDEQKAAIAQRLIRK